MLKKLETKERNIVFVISMIISCLLYIIFLQGYYSLDAHRLMIPGFDYYAINDASFNDGRLFMGWICLIGDALNLSYVPFYQILLFIAIIISCACVVEIYKTVNHYKPLTKKVNKVLIFLVSFLYIFNFFYVNSMEFVECIVMAISIYMYIKAIQYIIIENKYIIGILFTIIGMFVYQGTAPLFVSTAILISILENKQINKKCIKQLCVCAISLIIAVFLDEIFINLYNIGGNSRASGENAFKYLFLNISNFYVTIVYSLRMFPTYLWLILVFLILLVIFFYCKKVKKLNVPIYTLFIIIFTCCSQFILFILEESNYPHQGRTFLAIGSLISSIIIYAYVSTNILEDKNKYKDILSGIIIFYFLVTAVETVYLQISYKQAMKIDYSFSKKIEQIIEKEKENGNEVTQMCFYYRESSNDVKLNIEGAVRERSKLAVGTYGVYTYEIYTGKDIKYNLEAEEEEYKKYFENQNTPIEFKVVGDTVYIGVLV